MFETAIGVALFCVLPFVLVVGGYLIYKIWAANPHEVEKVRQLKHTVKLANEGVPNAILACEEDYRIRKGIRYVSGRIITHYSVPSRVILHAFNMNT